MKLSNAESLPFSGAGSRGAWWHRLSCALWGHHVDNHLLQHEHGDCHCRCGAQYLQRDGTLTRVRHTLSCFLDHHTYELLTERDGCREYVCVQCGHPLVYPRGADPYAAAAGFRKKVRYWCGLFGHKVQSVATRDGYTEYVCHCGHSFLKEERQGAKIHHPLVCVFFGHFNRYVTSRAGYDEFICVNCGHPFCFAGARSGTRNQELGTRN